MKKKCITLALLTLLLINVTGMQRNSNLEKKLLQTLNQLKKSLKTLSIQLTQPKSHARQEEPRRPERKYQQQPQTFQLLQRKDFFSDIVKMSEGQFRTDLDWSNELLQKLPAANGHLKKVPWKPQKQAKWIIDWIKKYSRRAAIFQGEFRCQSIFEIEKMVNDCRLPQPSSNFVIRLFDPLNPALTDIRFLQSLSKNKFAAFQIASTFFGPLEGGMIDFDAKLEGMLRRPVQGEEASISAAGATIYRKYFMPTYRIKANPENYGYFNLLHKLQPKLSIEKAPHGLKVNFASIYNYSYSADDISRVLIGIHKNIAVSSGYGIDDYQIKLPIMVKQNLTDENIFKGEIVDITQTQVVTQIFTSALDLKKLDITDQNVINASQMILYATYRGTLSAAYATWCQQPKNQKNNKLFLTLVGGGSFRNPIANIENAIIYASPQTTGLNTTLLYRPDTRRPNKDAEKQFLIKMINLMPNAANKLNTKIEIINEKRKTTTNLTALINSYIDEFYAGRESSTSFIANTINKFLDSTYEEELNSAKDLYKQLQQ